MTTKDRLKQYIEEDKIYNNWVNNNLNELSDFDKFCIQHCNDIKEILEENQELKKQLKIKHDGFMESVEESCELAEENQKYKEVIDKAIEYINGAYEMAIYTKSVGLEEENIEDLLNILKEVE